MHVFDQLCNDTGTIVKKSGQRLGPFKCQLSGKEALFFEKNLDVDEGDQIERVLPNDKIEIYQILEVEYCPGLHQIPPSWQLHVRKDGSLRRPPVSSTTNINISHSQGFQVGDHNYQQVAATLDLLVREIDKANATPEQKAEAKSVMKAFLEHPIIAAIVGAAAGSATTALASGS